jgi:NADH-quinone oxidoreductase subunit J
LLVFLAAAALWFSTGPTLRANLSAAVTWGLTLVAIGSAVSMTASRKPVYSAIWFALTLLAVGGLFFAAGAQFLGVATVAVYAGAILVTFLFVLMLAQPEGQAFYDRLSWGWFARFGGTFAGLALTTWLIAAVRTLPPATEASAGETPILSNPEHVASLGARMFSIYLVEVQLAGVLLFVALVGAVMIASRRPTRWNWNSALERALTATRELK